MTPPINIDGSQVSGITIDGESVSEVTVDGDVVFGAIPDSAINRWRIGEGSGSTWGDAIGSADFSVNGGSWVSDSNAEGGYKYSQDGSDDFSSATRDIDSFSVLLISITVETTVSSGKHISVSWGEDGAFGGITLRINPDGNGQARIDVGDGSTYVSVKSTTAVNDGSKHRIQAWFEENDVVGMGVDGSQENTASFGTRGDASSELEIGRNTIVDGEYIAQDVDHPILYNPSTVDSQLLTDDYNLQPWS